MKDTLKNPGVQAVFTLAVALLAAACGGGGGAEAPAAAETAARAEGHELFKQTCAVCHGQGGEGMPALGKNLNANEFVNASTDAQLVEFLELGRPATHPDNTRGVDMPPKGGNPTLTDEDLAKIVTYLRSLQ